LPSKSISQASKPRRWSIEIAVLGLLREGTRAGPKRIVPTRGSYAVRGCGYLQPMAKRPSRIDLLELDIDLRLADLWREAADIGDWNLEVVAAFMRAAYGKGYCDALTEDNPGSLCEEHGYRVPSRRTEPARER
jgi:hypothetical protein